MQSANLLTMLLNHDADLHDTGATHLLKYNTFHYDACIINWRVQIQQSKQVYTLPQHCGCTCS